MKFRNLAEIPGNFWQLKFKVVGKDYQPFYSTLPAAIKARNTYYRKQKYRPHGLYVKVFSLDEAIRPFERTYTSGNTYTRFQVHYRRLEDRKYFPREFKSKVDAERFARKWVNDYNKVAKEYNKQREKAFLVQIREEAKTRTPQIVTGFDVILWNRCYTAVFECA